MAVDIFSLTRPFGGESACGDRCDWWLQGSRLTLSVVDGLGHGQQAAYAADAAAVGISEHLSSSCEDMFYHCDINLQNTRGAALAIATINLVTQEMSIASVGNIRSVLLQGNSVFRFGGARGIVGAGYEFLAPEKITLKSGDLLAMYTDGLDEMANLKPYYQQREIALEQHVTAMLDNWQNVKDDAGVLLYRHQTLAI